MPSKSKSRTQTEDNTEQKNTRDRISYDIISAKIHERTGHTARKFPVQATQAILEGQDVVVHAGTGRGKTLIFAAPHFVLEHKISIVILPLILLQHDQRDRMKRMHLNAIAINKEVHIESNVWEDISQGKYQIIFLSPEMALHSERVKTLFLTVSFQQCLIALHVDEGHTISLWGGDFRKDYKGLGRIRARLPKGIPTSIVSATLRPNVKNDAMATLGFSSNPSEFTDINEGNERGNIFIGVVPMKHSGSSFKSLAPLIDPNESDPSKIPKTIVYIDDVVDVTLAVITLYSWLHPSLRSTCLIMPVHAWMPPWYRTEAMAKFTTGEVRILVCTEAAGMKFICSCKSDDVVDVTLAVITLYSWLRPSLRNTCLIMPVHTWMPPWYRTEAMAKFTTGEVWILVCTEAAGMGCDIPDIKRVVQFGICQSIDAFVQRIGRAWRGNDGTGEGWLFYEPWVRNERATSTGQSKRKCDALLRGLVMESGCRQTHKAAETTVADRECCDICDPESTNRLAHRTIESEQGPPRAAAVSGEIDPKMLSCLEDWREGIASKVFGSDSLYGPEALISDHDIERVARRRPSSLNPTTTPVSYQMARG
ncbi:unnamed protein product [Rhizoctonia solani]|uniref:DNA 3'-5' helicase n=1 Tax=Rhizoctonia solani TaxID=456999 RepID=A0A8H3H258_9AGAM|nr:unnamed protein product [Rhizoctonia solani]